MGWMMPVAPLRSLETFSVAVGKRLELYHGSTVYAYAPLGPPDRAVLLSVHPKHDSMDHVASNVSSDRSQKLHQITSVTHCIDGRTPWVRSTDTAKVIQPASEVRRSCIRHIGSLTTLKSPHVPTVSVCSLLNILPYRLAPDERRRREGGAELAKRPPRPRFSFRPFCCPRTA